MQMQSMLLNVICLLHVYVCYMLLYVICLLYVIYLLCLVLGPSCYMYMSVICCYMLYFCDMLYVCYMSSARGGSRGIGYMLFNAYLCNHILLQSGGGTWDTGLYTVRGVGSGSRDVDDWHTNGSVLRGSGYPSTDDPGAWQHCGDSMLRQHCPAPRKT